MHRGGRYGDRADLGRAIEEYVRVKDSLQQLGMGENLLAAYLWSERFSDLYDYAKSLSADVATARASQVAAVMVLRGEQAAADEAGRLGPSDAERSTILAGAGELLLAIRRYAPAAALLRRSATGSTHAGAADTRAQLMASVRRLEDLPVTEEPVTSVHRLIALMFEPGDQVDSLIAQTFSRHTLENTTLREDVRSMREVGRILRRAMQSRNIPVPVIRDLMVSTAEFRVEGDLSRGFVVVTATIGGSPTSFLVVSESGRYKLLADLETPAAVGLDVLARIAGGDLVSAKNLLDRTRQDVQPAGGDDEFAGPLLPRFWSRSNAADPVVMNCAAASLLIKVAPATAIPILEEGLSRANGPGRAGFLLALEEAYATEGIREKRLDAARALVAIAPDSTAANWRLFHALVSLNRYQEALQFATNLRNAKGDDLYPVRLAVKALNYLARWPESAALQETMLDSGRATPGDYNNLAWQALFSGQPVTTRDIERAQKAVTDTRRSHATYLHTLAALYAEVGKTAEARDTLDAAMDLLGLEEPTSDYWYVLGRIAEQYGAASTARLCYSKMDAGEDDGSSPYPTVRLGLARLKALESSPRRTASGTSGRATGGQ